MTPILRRRKKKLRQKLDVLLVSDVTDLQQIMWSSEKSA